MPPLWLARAVTVVSEAVAHLRGATEAPRFNSTSLKFLGLNLDFSIEKAKRELGYQPRVTFDDGLRQTMAWYRQNA